MFFILIFGDKFFISNFSILCREKLALISPNDSIIQDAAVNPAHRCTLLFLIKAQISKDKYVSQKTTLRHPISLTKAMDGLFKYTGSLVR